MPRRCTVCAHPKRREIDSALVEGRLGYRDLARRFSITKDAINRHVGNHLSKRLERAKMWDTEQLAAKLQALDADVQHVLKRGKQSGDDRLILSGVETAGRNIERIYKIGIASDLEQRLKAIEEAHAGDGSDDQ